MIKASIRLHSKEILRHTNSVHEGLKYICDQCEYKVIKQRNHKKHKQSVYEGVTCNCDQCEYNATNLGNLDTQENCL